MQRYGINLPPQTQQIAAPTNPPQAQPPNPLKLQTHEMFNKKLINLSCHCELERNNCPVTALRKEKIKLVSLLESKEGLFFTIKFQKCGTEVFRCHSK